MDLKLTQAYNYRLLETILQSLRKYWAFTLNTEDYDEIFKMGKRGEIIRPVKEDIAHDAIHTLSGWSGIPIDLLYGERPITTGIYLNKQVEERELRRLDDRVYGIMALDDFDDLWNDPLGLDAYTGIEALYYNMNTLLEALVFKLKRAGRLESVTTLKPRQNRALGEVTPHLRELADALLAVSGENPASAATDVEILEKDLAILHYGAPFEKLVCKLAGAKR